MEITIFNPDKCGKCVSEQLREHGARISDSIDKSFVDTIFEEFKVACPEYYYLSEVEDYEPGSDEYCGLCGHDIATGYTVRAKSDPLVTNNSEIDMTVTWPSAIVVGSGCVKMLGIQSYTSKFVDSCLLKESHVAYRIDKNGLVDMKCVIEQHAVWAFDMLILPHSVFSPLPQEVMEESGMVFAHMRNPFDPKKKYQKTLWRSFKARRGKWKPDHHVTPSHYYASFDRKTPQNDWATVVTLDEARAATEIINKK